jgi:DNA mismatch repair ATPase MutS
MALITHYFGLLENYKSKYGNKTFLLMQVGSFYEVYSKSCTEEYMTTFSQLCDLKIANKTDGYFMAGFRDYMIDKYLSISCKLNTFKSCLDKFVILYSFDRLFFIIFAILPFPPVTNIFIFNIYKNL